MRKYTGKKYDSSNDPQLLRRFLAHADRLAKASGFAERLEAFNEKAAGFPNAPEMHIAAIVERPAILTPDQEAWEAAFRRVSDERRALEEPELPDELVKLMDDTKAELKEAARRRREAALTGGTSEAGGDAVAGSEGAAQTAKQRRAAQLEAEARAKFGADELEQRAAALRGEGGDAAQFVAASSRVVPRTTKNDELGNTRSLDRAYADRLVLFVKERATGRWTLPTAAFDAAATAELEAEEPSLSPMGERLPTMAAATARLIAGSLGPDVSAWVVGSGPVAVHLEEYDEERRAAEERLGRRLFLLRADIIDGRPELDADRYDDFQWLTRLEARDAGILRAHSPGFEDVAFAAMGWDAQEFIHRAGLTPTESGVPSDEAIEAAVEALVAANAASPATAAE